MTNPCQNCKAENSATMNECNTCHKPTTTYNGWANWETWSVYTGITNHEDALSIAKSAPSPEELALHYYAMKEQEIIPSGYCYIAREDFDKVNWREVYNAIHDA